MVGANRDGYHLVGVTAGKDFACEFADLQVALPGEGCPKCGKPLSVERVIEVGNIFKLGTKYSEPLGAMYLDEQGQQQPIVMGSYGIGPARIAAAADRAAPRRGRHHLALGDRAVPGPHRSRRRVKDAAQMAAAERDLRRALEAAGFEVLMDDRDERAGVKFKDADLLGVPIRVTVGNALAKEGVVEIRERADPGGMGSAPRAAFSRPFARSSRRAGDGLRVPSDRAQGHPALAGGVYMC